MYPLRAVLIAVRVLSACARAAAQVTFDRPAQADAVPDPHAAVSAAVTAAERSAQVRAGRARRPRVVVCQAVAHGARGRRSGSRMGMCR